MTILLENRPIGQEKIIELPDSLGFAAMVAMVREVEPDRRWQIAEYG